MYDCYNRQIDYLRISVTDRCNLRCSYCMPEEGIKLLEHKDILTFDEITEIVKVAVKLGIIKVRLTGGEPLVRKGIVSLVSMLSSIEGINDLSLTTNGVLLEDFAKPLYEAGLHRVNISLDTLNPSRYAEITRGGDINKVLKGIRTAKETGFKPVKINCVVQQENVDDIEDLKKFCEKEKLILQQIHKMSLTHGNFSIVEGGKGGNCSICNRIRLTANGKLKPCLFNNLEFDVRELGIEEAIKKAISSKPEKGSTNKINQFYNIGG